ARGRLVVRSVPDPERRIRIRERVVSLGIVEEVRVDAVDREMTLAPCAKSLDDRIGGLDEQIAARPVGGRILGSVGEDREIGKPVDRAYDHRLKRGGKLDGDGIRLVLSDGFDDELSELETVVAD